MNTSEKCVYWQHQVTAQALSGLTRAAFCQQQQLSLATFHYWAKKLNTEPLPPALIPLQLGAEAHAASAAPLLLTSPSGWQLSFPPSRGRFRKRNLKYVKALVAVVAV